LTTALEQLQQHCDAARQERFLIQNKNPFNKKRPMSP